MQHFSQNSILCVHPSAAAGLRQAFVNDRNGEILLCVTLPCIKETVRFPPEGPDGGGCYVRVSRAGLLPDTGGQQRAVPCHRAGYVGPGERRYVGIHLWFDHPK